MNDTPFAAIHEAEVTWQADTPVSVLHDDPYFSLAGGAEETRHVFLSGNDLQRRFSALHPGDRFTVAETGFGTGLNFLETLALFDQCAPAGARLHFLSTELQPLSLADLKRAHRAWPEHGARCHQLQAQWPAATPGWHTLWFGRDRVTLTLLYGDTTDQLRLLDGRVDAWFLDGFSPSRNDSMWQPELYQQMARLSHAHTTAATYSAAGHVR
ncbi:MAG: tRNA (5-methylaminomethyl-2-thiouridine)(34)-methyltransferase MnmD, partial [Alcanivoracaceae bacterium]